MDRFEPPVFDWDAGNISHIAKHDVTTVEAEQVVLGATVMLDVEERNGEDRHTELGQTAAGRLLLVVWTGRLGKVRVVTAFPANRKWRAVWQRLSGETPVM